MRALAGCELDKDVSSFDVFTGLWWPLRRKSQAAPRREVAWLIAKLYAAIPVPHLKSSNEKLTTLAQTVGRGEPHEDLAQKRFRRRFNLLLCNPLSGLEPHLRWALSVARQEVVARHAMGIDWIQLTDHLSIWDKGEEHRLKRDIREIWAEQYLETSNKRN